MPDVSDKLDDPEGPDDLDDPDGSNNMDEPENPNGPDDLMIWMGRTTQKDSMTQTTTTIWTG